MGFSFYKKNVEYLSMNYIGTKRLETERLILRKFEEKDYKDMFKNYASSEKVTRFLTWNAYTRVEDCKDFLNNFILKKYKENNDETFAWAIVDKATNEVIGSIDVVKFYKDYEIVEIGYVLSETYWNKGIMSEAFKEVINYLFNEVNVHAITATHNVLNPASGKVMEHNGLIYIKDENKIIKGKEVICKRYKLINNNYKR